MAKLKNGINGPVSGKVGNVVGGSWNGIEYVRSTPVITKPKTEAQLKNQHLFAVAAKWLQPVKEYVDLGFRGYAPTNFGINAAKSVLYKTSLVRDGYDSYVDASLAILSYGSLDMSPGMQAQLLPNKQLVFSWNPGPVEEGCPEDQAMLLAYDPKTKQCNYSLKGEFRKKGSDRLDMIHMPAGTYELYAAFVAEDRSRQSMSLYLGVVEL